MNNPEILEQIKQLNLLIGNALKEASGGQNILFFKNVLQQNAINLYQKASLLEDTHQAKPIELKADSHAPAPEKPEPLPEPVRHEATEPVKPMQENVVIENKPAETIPAQLIKPKIKIVQEPDKDVQELSLNERLSKNKQPVMNFGDKSKETPIKDLVKSISLAQKFEFINGLFDGNADSYKSSLQKIQDASSYEEATEFLEANIMGPYEWHTNEQLAAQFFGLIKRRFAS